MTFVCLTFAPVSPALLACAAATYITLKKPPRYEELGEPIRSLVRPLKSSILHSRESRTHTCTVITPKISSFVIKPRSPVTSPETSKSQSAASAAYQADVADDLVGAPEQSRFWHSILKGLSGDQISPCCAYIFKMPGILPMKVIKVGTSSQSRIAQACDRCRSKKIRCDGVRPCCSQCANVGFECKTSDKLSRRAFPRGYTESLEERVRSLEAENRELKDLLDEKDEKIDMLSRMHSNSSPSRRSSSSVSSIPNIEQKPNIPQNKEDVFRVQQSPFLLEREDSDSYFMGGSSGRGFIGRSREHVYRTMQSTEFMQMHSSVGYRRLAGPAPTSTRTGSSR